MLRLASSQIGLSSKDLAWHKDRHHDRQASRDDGHPVEVIGSPVRSCPETPDNLKLALPYCFPRLSYCERRIRHNDEDEDDDLFFNEPVPQGSRAFWDRIMANAGTPLGIQVQHVDRRPRIIEKSKASQGIIRSSKGSIEHVLSGNMEIAEAHDYSDSSPYLYEPSHDAECSSQLQSRFSTKFAFFPSIGLGKEMLSSNGSAEQLLASGASSVFTLPPSHRQDLVGAQREYHGRTLHQVSGSMELDGSSDLGRYHRKIQGQGASKRPDMQQGGYGAGDDSAERAVLNGLLWKPRFETESLALTSSPPQDPCKLAISPQLPVSRMMQAMRRRSSGLQRSPLCISHAVASSSPEKQSRASPDPSTKTRARAASSPEKQFLREANPSGDGVSEASGVFSLPIRRRKKYGIPSRSNFLVSQEVSQNPGSPQGATSLNKHVAWGRSATSPVPLTEPSHSPASFTPSPPHLLTPSPSSTTHRSLNPNAIPFTPNNTPPMPTPRRLFPSSTLLVPPPASLPSYPFSATPRSVSLSGSTASPSPFARPSSPCQPRFSSSPPSPPLTVYNDRLPAISQPQTPAQLSRNAFSTMPSLRASGAGITQTAPAGDNRGSWPRYAFVARTPTRRSRYERLEDQENITINVEFDRRREQEIAARRRRRARARGGGGVEVAGGDGVGQEVVIEQGDGFLATTPE